MMNPRWAASCRLVLFILMPIVSAVPIAKDDDKSQNAPYAWVLNLTINALFYSGVILPLFLLRFYYLRRRKQIGLSQLDDTRHRRGLSKLALLCFVPDVNQDAGDNAPNNSRGSALLPLSVNDPHVTSSPVARWVIRVQRAFGLHLEQQERTTGQRGALLVICALGLQVFYVMWGVMQERIMTREYDGKMFENSQFLVFCNRLFSLVIVFPIHLLHVNIPCNPLEPGRRAPFFEFSFASVSNIVSSWCQYEALKYVTFPTQVISKACKVIPVMIMGWFIQRRSYTRLEYVTAGFVSIGMSMFMLSDPAGQEAHVNRLASSDLTAFSGALLIIGYMAFDSFTSNWQDKLFRQYHLSPIQVMAGVNTWSLILTLFPLVYRGTLISSVQFAIAHPEFNLDVMSSATCSAFGQLFIFLTIAQFGPATFALIMTLRMGLSLLLSCLLFGHRLSLVGVFGVLLVFAALFARIYLRSRRKSAAPPPPPDANSTA